MMQTDVQTPLERAMNASATAVELLNLTLDERDATHEAIDDALWRLALSLQWADQFWIGQTRFCQYVEDTFMMLHRARSSAK